MKKGRNIIRCFILLLSCILITGMSRTQAYAAGTDLRFDSEEYTQYSNKAFYLGVYLDSNEEIDEYRIELSYDERYLTYVSGADEGGEGRIVLSGNPEGGQEERFIIFQAVAGGDTEVKVTSVSAKNADGEEIDIEASPAAAIHLYANADALISELSINGKTVTGFEPDILSYELTVPYSAEYLDVDANAADGVWVNLPDTALTGGENEVYIEANGADNARNIYKFKVIRASESAEDQAESSGHFFDISNPGMDIIIIALFAIILLLLLIKFRKHGKKAEKQAKAKTGSDEKVSDDENREEIINEQPAEALESILTEERKRPEGYDEADSAEYEVPVISVCDVSMLFKVATQNVSGLKEFFIQKIKRKLSYRKFYALRHISFDVFKGEVVGIIGTNGSGKSTLLKIVSGALEPTEGKVIVNHSKVQLLTLGTGFDMELTAKENVYLNGSIIGYSKEFIDSVYDDIVAFAELESFMEEKVKNFSSGMVSRLGFAIATIGDAPEILILDEVLSVGDEFFRKKSLARVKEMIHGGSTVLLVSHNMNTIRENCSKVVWIEKGELRMIGDAKEVCKAYQQMGITQE